MNCDHCGITLTEETGGRGDCLPGQHVDTNWCDDCWDEANSPTGYVDIITLIDPNSSDTHTPLYILPYHEDRTEADLVKWAEAKYLAELNTEPTTNDEEPTEPWTSLQELGCRLEVHQGFPLTFGSGRTK